VIAAARHIDFIELVMVISPDLSGLPASQFGGMLLHVRWKLEEKVTGGINYFAIDFLGCVGFCSVAGEAMQARI